MKTEMITDFIAKDVFSLEDGQYIGYVLRGEFNSNLSALEGFIVIDEESEQEKFLNVKNIKIIGKNAIFIDNLSKIEINFANYCNYPIGKMLFDKKGQSFGQVKNIELRNLKPFKLITEFCEISTGAICASGRNCVFVGKKSRESKSVFNQQTNLPKVEIQSGTDWSDVSLVPPKKEFTLPIKVTLAPSSLLNKRATADIFGFNNELIIKEGQVITQNKIDKAKKHNKINLLMINSK